MIKGQRSHKWVREGFNRKRGKGMSEFLAEILVLAVAVIAVCKVVELFRGD